MIGRVKRFISIRISKLKSKIFKNNLPSHFIIEASTVCQLKCADCYMRKTENPQCGIGFLKFEDFKKIIDENAFIKSIELSNSGEVFLNPDILRMLEYACRKNVQLTAYNGVNFNTVSDEVLEGLVKYGFVGMTISIDGASQETYSVYRVGGNFDKVISNIRKLNEYKKKYDTNLPDLQWQYILFGHNEHEIPLAKTLAQELNMRLSFKLSWNDDFSPIKNLNYVKQETGLTYVSRKEHLEKEGKPYIQACNLLWDMPTINWNGQLLGCCCLYLSDFDVNVFKIGLRKALKSEKYKYAKAMLTNKKPPREDVPCANCNAFKIMQKYNCYVKR
ncbi:MAG: radical SAM protein [Candidatus Gastranaerophilales bacterium]|nr:radical SAM protein [Candidatus Gastranaerophilales bacterium]